MNRLGESNLMVSRIGLGLAALGRPGYINLGHGDDLPESHDVQAMQEHANRVLDAAWQAGVRYFDAARSYGRAEIFLSSWLTSRGIDPADVTIGSKWGYTYTADWQIQLPAGEPHEVKDHSLSLLNPQVTESQRILGAHLDLYQIHSATLESGVLENDEVIGRLAELRDAGLTIGLSVSGPRQSETIRRALSIERGDRPVFESVQATWNLLEQSAGGALAEAHAAGRGVIVKEALANGRLTPRNLDAGFREKLGPVYQFADTNGLSLDALALALALQQPWTSVVLSGAATVEQLASNLQGSGLAQSPELDYLTTRVPGFAEWPETYWSIRRRLSWN